MQNYRPISLLSIFYKIVVSIVKERSDNGLDHWINKTQYGFRRGRSTAQEMLEMITGNDGTVTHPLKLILLYWENAFDKIDHDKLFEA